MNFPLASAGQTNWPGGGAAPRREPRAGRVVTRTVRGRSFPSATSEPVRVPRGHAFNSTAVRLPGSPSFTDCRRIQRPPISRVASTVRPALAHRTTDRPADAGFSSRISVVSGSRSRAVPCHDLGLGSEKPLFAASSNRTQAREAESAAPTAGTEPRIARRPRTIIRESNHQGTESTSHNDLLELKYYFKKAGPPPSLGSSQRPAERGGSFQLSVYCGWAANCRIIDSRLASRFSSSALRAASSAFFCCTSL